MVIRLEDEDFMRIGVDVPDEDDHFGVEKRDGPPALIGRRSSDRSGGMFDLEGELPFYHEDFPADAPGLGVAKAAVSRRRIGPDGNPNMGVEVWARRRRGRPPGAGKPDGKGDGKGQGKGKK